MLRFFYRKKAFSLVELSVVMAIMAILISSSLSLLQGRLSITRKRDDYDRIKLLKDSLDTYFKKYQRLPCPADHTLPLTNSSFGSEILDQFGGCSTAYQGMGVDNVFSSQRLYNHQFSNTINAGAEFTGWKFGGIPSKALGLPDSYAFDSYGNRISYIVLDSLASYRRSSNARYARNTIVYTKAKVLASTNMAACTKQDFFGLAVLPDGNEVFPACNIAIMSSDNDAILEETRNGLAYVIVGHGKNGNGAWGANGQLNTASVSLQEQSNSYAHYMNANGVNADNYVFTNGGNAKGMVFYQGRERSGFDDIVQWSTIADLLMNNNLGGLVYCHPSTYDYGGLQISGLTMAAAGESITINMNNAVKKINCLQGGVWSG